MRKRLSEIRPGQSGTIVSIASSEIAPKLVEMGLYEGREVRVLFSAPLGDPIAVDVGDYVLSLRLDEASLVTTESLAS